MPSLDNIRNCDTCDHFKAKLPDKELAQECSHPDKEYRDMYLLDGVYTASYCNGYREKSAVEAIYQDVADKTVSNETALPFILAGKSEFTIVSKRTGKSFSFILTKKESNQPNSSEFIYFLSYGTSKDKVYCGIIFYNDENSCFVFRKGQKGNMNPDDIRIKSLLYVLNNLNRKNYSLEVLIFHCGRCGRCGKKLTTPESILTGLGPECSKKSGVPRVKL